MSETDASVVKSWLKAILKDENITDLSVDLTGNLAKGNSFLSDVIFVEVDAEINNESGKKFNLVLKSSKKDESLMESSPIMMDVFSSEIYMYDTVLPAFKKFQLEKGIDEVFDGVPKYYGKFISEDCKAFALENLSPKGYKVCDKKSPLTRKHVELVLGEYAKLHATSAAMRDQKPEIYQKLVSGLKPAFKSFMETSDMDFMFGSKIDKACELLKNEIDEEILAKWKNLRTQIISIFNNMYNNKDGFKVFVQGDCWITNFMFNYEENNEDPPLKAILLDLQLASNSSPVLDLSYFLFTTISEQDIEDLNNILEYYYKQFSKYLQKLGSEAERVYPYKEFLNDWKIYCKYGLVICATSLYVCSSDENDIADSTKSSEDFSKTFSYEIRDPTIFKNRMTYIMNYVNKHDLI